MSAGRRSLIAKVTKCNPVGVTFQPGALWGDITGGKRHSGKTNKGNRWLGEILNQSAVAASHTRDTYLAAQFWRLKRRIGHKKAAVAVGHSILVICWHLLTNNCDYQDLGGDWFMRRTDTDKRRDFLIRQLHNLGYGVALTKVAERVQEIFLTGRTPRGAARVAPDRVRVAVPSMSHSDNRHSR